MTYAYIRVSTKNQLIDRQLLEIQKLEVPTKHIYIDKESGKDFNRKQYMKLRHKIKKDDLVIIKNIDRLGRNYQMIIDEWSYITRSVGADIKVIDMPLLDTRNHPENLVGKFISDIVLQILSFVAENERDNIKQRQAEGIRIAKEKGVHMGRPKYVKPDNFDELVSLYKNKEISLQETISKLKLSKSTFYKYLI